MEESTYERDLLDRVAGVVRANTRCRARTLVLDIERSIGTVFEGWDPPKVAHQEIYRNLCFAAGEGQNRDWLRGHMRDEMCNGLLT